MEYRRADLPGVPPDLVQVLFHASIKFVLALVGPTWDFLQVKHRGLYHLLRSLPLPPFCHLVASYLHLTDLGQMTPSLLLMIQKLWVPSSLDASIPQIELGVGLGLRLEIGG